MLPGRDRFGVVVISVGTVLVGSRRFVLAARSLSIDTLVKCSCQRLRGDGKRGRNIGGPSAVNAASRVTDVPHGWDTASRMSFLQGSRFFSEDARPAIA
jgi:hypothetical protein